MRVVNDLHFEISLEKTKPNHMLQTHKAFGCECLKRRLLK